MNRPDPLVIAIVGAECTGKTVLAKALAVRLAEEIGLQCVWVPAQLRAWWDMHQRAPRRDELTAIAGTQVQAIEHAARSHDLVVCDTTPLMIASYSRIMFGDDSLVAAAVKWQRRCALTLLTAVDLPWVADDHQREGQRSQARVDSVLRDLLLGNRLPWALVSGRDRLREEHALDAVAPLLRKRPLPRDGLFTRLHKRNEESSRWYWRCDTCDVPDCEHLALRMRRDEAPVSRS